MSGFCFFLRKSLIRLFYSKQKYQSLRFNWVRMGSYIFDIGFGITQRIKNIDTCLRLEILDSIST